MGYPTVDRVALADLLADEEARARVTLMVDDPRTSSLIEAGRAVGRPGRASRSTSTPACGWGRSARRPQAVAAVRRRRGRRAGP